MWSRIYTKMRPPNKNRGGAFHTFESNSKTKLCQNIVSFDKSTKSQHINPLYYFNSLFQGIKSRSIARTVH
jgi:hypothetical protein